MIAKCIGCGLYWNISITAKIPRRGYTCPHCDSRIRAGESIQQIQADRKRRPTYKKGAQP